MGCEMVVMVGGVCVQQGMGRGAAGGSEQVAVEGRVVMGVGAGDDWLGAKTLITGYMEKMSLDE